MSFGSAMAIPMMIHRGLPVSDERKIDAKAQPTRLIINALATRIVDMASASRAVATERLIANAVDPNRPRNNASPTAPRSASVPIYALWAWSPFWRKLKLLRSTPGVRSISSFALGSKLPYPRPRRGRSPTDVNAARQALSRPEPVFPCDVKTASTRCESACDVSLYAPTTPYTVYNSSPVHRMGSRTTTTGEYL